MHAERLVKILAANPNPDPAEAELARALVMSDSPPRDLEAEAELSRALARNGGDGLTACGEDAGLCPKPRLRHRRVNVGVWPNWRLEESFVGWSMKGYECPLAFSGTTIGGYLDSKNCGTYQDHLETIERKERLIAFMKAQQQGARIGLPEATYTTDSTPNGASGAFGALLDGMVRQARNISDNIGISPMWDREPSRPSWAQSGEERVWWDRNLGSLRSSNPPDTTWHAQYPEQVWNERSEPQWTVSSNIPRPFEGRTYRFDPISITVSLPDEPHPAAPDYSSLLAAALPQQPAQDSSTEASPLTPEPIQGHPTTLALPQSSPSRSS